MISKKHALASLGLGLASFLSLAGMAAAQTTTTTTTPGVPTTGAGGMATANMIVLSSSALVAIGSVALLRRKNA